jgi:hypothetical protein
VDKLLWHKRNINFMKRRGYRNGSLQGSYFEVVDDTTPQSYTLLVEDEVTRCVPATGFIAVNNRPEAILRHPRKPPYHLFCDDALDLAVRLSRMTSADLARHRIATPVTVYNFDLQRNADATSDFWGTHWEQLHEVVLNTYKTQKLCSIILNMALHPRFLHDRGLRPSEAVAEHATKVYDTFRTLPVKGLTTSALLGDTPNALDEEARDVRGRESGAFQIYRKTSVPMVTLRLMFADGLALCGFADPFARRAA